MFENIVTTLPVSILLIYTVKSIFLQCEASFVFCILPVICKYKYKNTVLQLIGVDSYYLLPFDRKKWVVVTLKVSCWIYFFLNYSMQMQNKPYTCNIHNQSFNNVQSTLF